MNFIPSDRSDLSRRHFLAAAGVAAMTAAVPPALGQAAKGATTSGPDGEAVTGQEHWTRKGDAKLFLWETFDDVMSFFMKLPNPDKQFTVMAGISHASFQQKNCRMVYHILHSFFSQPEPSYRG